MKTFLVVLILAGAVLIPASLLTAPPRPDRPAAPMLAGADIDGHVREILERACRDCHSESPRYPWYSYVAPASWLVRQDVIRGREHLNLSRWAEYSSIRRQRCLSEIANQVRDREMPLPVYTLMHRQARLSGAEIEAVFAWTQAERTRLISEAADRR